MLKNYYYLAYGSNLNLKQMKMRCPNAKAIGTITLDGYRLVFKGSTNNHAFLTIEKNSDTFVPLGLFKLTKTDILSLDLYEGYPTFYSKFYIPISLKGKTENALIYVMNPDNEYHLPSEQYINTCKEGYEDFNFDIDIFNQAIIDTVNNLPKNNFQKKKIWPKN